MKEKEQYEQIEKHLAGKLSAEEASRFEQKMAQDPVLRETVAIHRQFQTSIPTGPKQMLRDNLRMIGQEFDDNGQEISARKRPWGLLLLLPLLVAAWWWSTSATPEPLPSPAVPIDTAETVDTPLPEVPASEPPATVEEPNSAAPPTGPSTSPPPAPEQQEPVAPPANLPIAANYTPNPQLENDLGSFSRGDFKLAINSPTPNKELYTQNGFYNLEFSGLLDTSLVPAEDFEMVLEVYDNSSDAYNLARNSYEQVLPLSSGSTSNWSYEEQVVLEVPKGLYYYLIRDDYSGAILGGGKLFLR